MQSLVTTVVSFPWALPVLVGVAALVLGLLIPRRGGVSWLVAILFFLPNLFLDFLDMVHTKKFKYYGLITALLAIEAFFAFRASTVYYDVLNTRMPGPEMAIVCVIVFVAVFLCGYMVATHGGRWNFWRVCTMVFVIFHDWAGTVWMNYSTAATATTTASITTPDDPLKVVLTVGMCVLGLLPFIMGAWAEELRPQLEQELDEEVDAFTSTATRKIKRRAVERVLRLANHTNIVHLVRALPADEFTEFKQFVMPIIAPGVAYNLPSQAPDGLPTPGQNVTPDGSQNHDILAEEKVLDDQPQTRQNGSQNVRQNGSPKPAIETAKDSSEAGQNGSQKSTSQTVKRDARIRQFAAEHPEMTRAKLAKRFGVSTRTIARILAGQKDVPLSTNGHDKMAQRDTDKLKRVSVEELTLAHQN